MEKKTLPIKSLLDDLAVSDSSMTESVASEESLPVPRRKPKKSSTRGLQSGKRHTTEAAAKETPRVDAPTTPPPALPPKSRLRPECASSAASEVYDVPRPRTIIESPFYCMTPIPRRHKPYRKEFRENYNNLKRDYKEYKKNIPETLSGYMRSIPDIIDDPKKLPPGSTLSSLASWRPVGNLIIKPLGQLDLEGFRLNSGPLPEHLKEVGAKISDDPPSPPSNTQTGSASQSQAMGAIPKKTKKADTKKAGVEAKKKKATKK